MHAGARAPKCRLGMVHVDWFYFRSPKHCEDGTTICSAVVENGKPRNPHACVEIKK
ncbi:hypothetical protein [Chondromyces crocatus]|uniref:Uncharacterized protein n=1 Tax=Chondromyces crocatus TaxID=52 RepID=A0A0K1EC16_CHOCO|nr:hypothetical protein [Chondromyces crocatus]AKT38399.1 uncharacterized protein CMC5_025450 [Chondromyces crocatus]